MLRGLKETYGWPGLTGLEPGALIQLLRRSAKDRSEAELVDRVDQLIRAGWMDLLAAPRSERAALAAAIAGRIDATAGALTPLADSCRRSLALGFGDRRAATPPARQAQQGWIGLAIATVLVAAAGFVLAVEAGRGRLEVAGLRERNQSQQEEIAKLEEALAKARDSLQQLESAAAAVVPSSPPSRLPEAPPDPWPMDRESDAAFSSTERWSGCETLTAGPALPRPGDVWWPVIGGPETLEAVRRHCRSEASTTADGRTEVARFPNLEVAERFASRITADPRHGFIFRVGEPTLF
ncbi:MAG: hypothetical protein HQ527_10760 [Cyanobacteria bacterium]|nr:hypothetical protein [Cyanobacteria bacterium bin.51]